MEKRLKKKLIIVSEYFYPNGRIDALLLQEISKKLSGIGHLELLVICATELNGADELVFLQNKIIRIRSSSLNEKIIFFRILKFIILTIKLSAKLFFVTNKDDRVLITTNPAFLVPIISLLRTFKKFEYTLLVYDVFPENLLAAKIISNKGIIYKLIKIIYDWAYSKADRLIVLGRDMKEVISTKTKNQIPIDIIENWCDHEAVTPLPKSENKILKSLNLQHKKVFLFAGNLGRVQGIETLLKASLLVEDVNFALLFIGDGVFKKQIIDFIDKNKNARVYYGGTFPPSCRNVFLNAGDVSIISLTNSMYGLGVPSKSYCNMAAEKPLLYIGEKNSEISRVILEEKIGWSIDTDNEEKIAETMTEICSKMEVLPALGKKARKVLIEKFSKKVILDKYLKLYQEK